MASPNPTGFATAERIAARSLAIVLREQAPPEQIGEWLLAVINGEDPPPIGASRGKGKTKPSSAIPIVEFDATHRLQALKMLLERAEGMPMQAIVLKAEIDARAHANANAGDIIDVEAIDPVAARVLEASLLAALGVGAAARPVIDADSIDLDSLEVDNDSEVP